MRNPSGEFVLKEKNKSNDDDQINDFPEFRGTLVHELCHAEVIYSPLRNNSFNEVFERVFSSTCLTITAA